jgi:acetylornithine/succinyldiaminopimelate/putrescine aminotransferase
METYKRVGIAPTGGKGSWLFDDEGNRYLDFIAGIATNSLGHGHPALVRPSRSSGEVDPLLQPLRVPCRLRSRKAHRRHGLRPGLFLQLRHESVEAAIKLARKHAYTTYGPTSTRS